MGECLRIDPKEIDVTMVNTAQNISWKVFVNARLNPRVS